MNSAAHDNDILLARIGAAHGIRGEVRVKPFGEPGMLDQYGPLHDAQGRKYRILSLRPQKEMLVVRFKGVDSREKAEALNGIELYVNRSILPEPEDEDEFYLSDLIGLVAVSPEGVRVGEVKAVENYGAGDVVEIRMESGALELFVFTREVFPQVDIAGGQIVIVPPEVVSEREEGE